MKKPLPLCVFFLSLFIRFGTCDHGCNIIYDDGVITSRELIQGYNTVLGPVINLTYYDTALELSVKKLYVGSLRYPGGTVANYWNITNASYVVPCQTEEYNYCYRQRVVSKLPKQTFSPINFYNGIGSASNINGGNSIVIDLNALTMNGSDMLNQVNTLVNQFGNNMELYIELGNEYYLNKYKYEFPNSSVYVDKVIPLAKEIRSKLPNAKISIPTDRELQVNNILVVFILEHYILILILNRLVLIMHGMMN